MFNQYYLLFNYMELFDIIAIMLLIIVISVIIGLIIVNVVGKKMSEVQINIPPFPKPNVIVNINKKDNEKYNVEIKKHNEHDDTIKETFSGNVNGLNDLDIYKKNILENPEESDVIEYERYQCQKNNNSIKISPPENINLPINPLNNLSKEENILNCPSRLNNMTGNEELKSSGNCQGQQTNPENYYKIFKAYPSSLNDSRLRGYNISDFFGSAGIYDIGKIKLDDNNKFAKPNNYVFDH